MTEEQLPYHEQRRLRKAGILPPLPTKKERKPIPKISKKKAQEIADEKKRLGGEDTDLVKFFKNAMKRMVGRCAETGLVTETRIYAYAIRSICHILSQQHCESVKYHPCNWIEFDPGFHVKFDAMSWEEREQLGCWPIIRDKLIMVWPDLYPAERRHFPESVLKYMEQLKPF
jgi:hypothetical protein